MSLSSWQGSSVPVPRRRAGQHHRRRSTSTSVSSHLGQRPPVAHSARIPIVAARRVLTTSKLTKAAHLRPQDSTPARSATCLSRRSSRSSVEYGLAAEALRQDARNRPHCLARTRRLQRHRQSLPGEGGLREQSAGVPSERQARERGSQGRLCRDASPTSSTTADRDELGAALQAAVQASAVTSRLFTTRAAIASVAPSEALTARRRTLSCRTRVELA